MRSISGSTPFALGDAAEIAARVDEDMVDETEGGSKGRPNSPVADDPTT